jgi:hypothetical protein
MSGSAVLAPCHDRSQWDPGEGSPFGSVAWLVPWSDHYESFTRIFHPVYAGMEESSWRAMADLAGVAWEREIQFEQLGGDSCWSSVGDLGSARLAVLSAVLIEHVGDQPCTFGLWEGDAWISTTGLPGDPNGPYYIVDSESWRQSGTLTTMLRQYRLFKGLLSNLPRIGVRQQGMFVARQPTAMWNRGREVCLITDPDYDSSILAGPERLQSQVLNVGHSLESLAIPASGTLLWNPTAGGQILTGKDNPLGPSRG